MKNRCHYETCIGTICIEEMNNEVIALFIDKNFNNKEDCETDILRETNKQLQEYFNKQRKIFDVPINLIGTEFQKKVWNALRDIPYGETRSYGEIAKAIGQPKACRAIGGANNKNPIMIIVPCHRVIGSKGDLVGFGAGLKTKKFLLDIEK
ncbi:MAG: methylated-DNA--[protein]-cysteine S-methyltransferase [Clostridiales bacterium]|nr:methylated-DNA--[protein]-cysteine S-methyltransferase [Clostridiales bacterium]